MSGCTAPAGPLGLFLSGGGGEALAVAEWSPRIDITEDEREFLLKAELPQMRRDEVRVSVEGGSLSISGERRFECEDMDKRFHRIEREYGTFARSFSLPPGTSGRKVTAEFRDGVLRIHLPKDGVARTAKAIEVRPG